MPRLLSNPAIEETVYGEVSSDLIPATELSLEEFMEQWGTCFDAGHDDQAAEFALTGVSNGILHKIDVLKYFEAFMRHGLSDDCVEIHRDYDSMVGLSKTLPYNKSLDIFCLSPNNLVLTADNHIFHEPVGYIGILLEQVP